MVRLSCRVVFADDGCGGRVSCGTCSSWRLRPLWVARCLVASVVAPPAVDHLAARATAVPAYAIGSLALDWMIERVTGLS